MGRHRTGARVRGPYKHGRAWRVEQVGANGDRKLVSFATEEEAKKFVTVARRTLPGRATVGQSISEYRIYQHNKGNRPESVNTTEFRLLAWFDGMLDQPVGDVSEAELSRRYAKRMNEVSTDTHRNELSQIRTFFRWAQKNGKTNRNPAQGVEPMGRRRYGKQQLRNVEASKLWRECIKRAHEGRDDGLAVGLILVLGIRVSELLKRVKRDVDMAGGSVVLWITDAKSRAGVRNLSIPEPLGQMIWNRAQKLERPEDRLFSYEKTWPNDKTKEICLASGVPVVCAHGLRGTFATLSYNMGLPMEAISRQIGHADTYITRKHYLDREEISEARPSLVMRLLEGGKNEARQP